MEPKVNQSRILWHILVTLYLSLGIETGKERRCSR